MFGPLAVEELAPLQLAGAQHMQRARHIAHFVIGLDRGQGAVDVTGSEPPHRVADGKQPPDQAPLHIEGADHRGGNDADKGDEQQQHAAAAERIDQARGTTFDALLRGAHQVGDGLVHAALNGDVFVDRGVGAGGDEGLAGVTGENAVGANAERQQLSGDLVDLFVAERGRRGAQPVRRGLELILDMLEFRRFAHDRSFTDEAYEEMRLGGNFESHPRIRQLRQPLDQARVRLMQSVVELGDLRAQIAAFGDAVFERREISVEPLRQCVQLGDRRVVAVELLQLVQGVGQIDALAGH
ncbi:MAG: hypothetical protein WA858_04875 [Xanthobacteraceae bacterium]